jgi:Arc/MetJ-type ribon-helix-helix transcriptional regulator
MKSNAKSSITLPPDELKLVVSLQARLKAKSKVEVVRRGLRLLQETNGARENAASVSARVACHA